MSAEQAMDAVHELPVDDFTRIGPWPNDASWRALFRWLARGAGDPIDNAENEMMAQFMATEVRAEFRRLTTPLTLGRELVHKSLEYAIDRCVTLRAQRAAADGLPLPDATAATRFFLLINRWVAPSARVSESFVSRLVTAAIKKGARRGNALREAQRALAMADAIIARKQDEQQVIRLVLGEFAAALINKREQPSRAEGGSRDPRE